MIIIPEFLQIYTIQEKYPTHRIVSLERLYDSVMENRSSKCAFQKSSPHMSRCGMNGRRAAWAAFSEEQVSTLNCWAIHFSSDSLFRTSKYIHEIYAKIILFEHSQKPSAVISQSLYIVLYLLNSAHNFANL